MSWVSLRRAGPRGVRVRVLADAPIARLLPHAGMAAVAATVVAGLWIKAGAVPSDTVRTLVARMPPAEAAAAADAQPAS